MLNEERRAPRRDSFRANGLRGATASKLKDSSESKAPWREVFGEMKRRGIERAAGIGRSTLTIRAGTIRFSSKNRDFISGDKASIKGMID